MKLNSIKQIPLLLLLTISLCLAFATGNTHGETENESDLIETELNDENVLDSSLPKKWGGLVERFSSHPLVGTFKIATNESEETTATLEIPNKIKLLNYTRGLMEDGSSEFISFQFESGKLGGVKCLLTRKDLAIEKFDGMCPPEAKFGDSGAKRVTMERSDESD